MRPNHRGRPVQARHADDWLMTYADTITLLLCLLMVMLSLSNPKKNHPPAVPAVPPVRMQPKPIDPFSNLLIASMPDATGLARDDADDAVAAAPTPRIVRATVIPASPAPGRRIEPVPPPVGPANPATVPTGLARLMTQGAASVERHGSRMTTVQMSSAAFFDVGSAAISESGKDILREVAVSLESPQFENYQITVEGHTDDTPIHSPQFPSNWELSTARASAVVHFFLDQGIDPRRLRAAGYADTFPVAPNRDAEGRPIPENQAKNRRVVIKLERVEEPRD